MTGIFGGVGYVERTLLALVEAHRQRWSDCDVARRPGLVVGASAPDGLGALRKSGAGWSLVDGERAAYEMEAIVGDEMESWPPGRMDDHRRVPTVPATVAQVVVKTGSVRLAADWSGAFPVYWTHGNGGFCFSTLPGVLGAVSGGSIDPVGIISYVKDGYYVGPHTCFRKVSRVQAGQVVRYDGRTGELQVDETSRAWAGPSVELAPEAVAEKLWPVITTAVERAVPDTGRTGLMLSAGWDSRTLLAAAIACRERSLLKGLSHGDTRSRELRIATRLADEAGLRCRLRVIRSEEFRPEYLRLLYRKCGTAQFPYWGSSARVLAEEGVTCISAGVFGEILGGHYGRAMAMSGWTRMRWMARQLFFGPGNPRDLGTVTRAKGGDIRELLVRGVDTVGRFFDDDFWKDGEDRTEAFADAVEKQLARLRRRGVTYPERLAEAYLFEHRGAQFINAQLRTARTETSVAVPFAHRRLLELSGRIPIHVKFHNRLNRRMLAQMAPALLDHPTAAVLVRASAPVELQEASRVVRKAWDESRRWLHDASGRRLPAPRQSWIDFSFLTGSDQMRELARDFRWEGWNRGSIHRLADAICAGTWRGELHEPVLQLLKLYTLELELRAGGA